MLASIPFVSSVQTTHEAHKNGGRREMSSCAGMSQDDKPNDADAQSFVSREVSPENRFVSRLTCYAD